MERFAATLVVDAGPGGCEDLRSTIHLTIAAKGMLHVAMGGLG